MAWPRAKRDWSALEGKVVPPDRWPEFSELEKRIFVLLRGVSPAMTVKEIADELDLGTPDVQGAIDRWEMRTAVPSARVSIPEFLKLTETAARRVLLAMDQRKVDGADLKSLGSVFRELINARQILLGEPTTIVGSDHRKAMNDLVQLMLAEASRRGLQVSSDPKSGALIARRPVTIDAEGRPA